jgi:hypothetical protein
MDVTLGAVYVIEIGDYCAIESIPAIYSFIFIAPVGPLLPSCHFNEL